jgi:hypothetical protein
MNYLVRLQNRCMIPIKLFCQKSPRQIDIKNHNFVNLIMDIMFRRGFRNKFN